MTGTTNRRPSGVRRSRVGQMIDERPVTPAERKAWFDREVDDQVDGVEQQSDYQRY